MLRVSSTTFKPVLQQIRLLQVAKKNVSIVLPFLYLQKSKRSFDNFDPEFTDEAARLTPCDKSFIANINQNDFHGFSYVNVEFPAKEKETTSDGDINV